MNLTRFKKPFWVTLFYHQNKWHCHGVFVHTLKVMYWLYKNNRKDLLLAGLLHDIGKPITAFQDQEDLDNGGVDYSFTNHEEISYQLIKHCPNWLINDKTKNVIRYHYHIRGMHKAKLKNKTGKYNRYKRDWDNFTPEFKKTLAVFLKCDDLAKKRGWK